MDMNIRNIPEELMELIREHATKHNLTLRTYIVTRLSKIVGYSGGEDTSSSGSYVRCSECGRGRKKHQQ